MLRAGGVKICGLTRAEDAALAARLGADAIGLVLGAESLRRIELARARELAAAARAERSDVTVFGLFVNALADEVARAVETVPLDAVQLHGDESPEDVAALAARLPDCIVMKAVRVRDAADIASLTGYGCKVFLLDAYAPGKGPRGGRGETFDWSLAAEAAKSHRIILAGGLTPDNVAGAIERAQPFMVDVSSGVESAPGVKDAEKLRAFIANARGRGEE